MSLGKIKNKIVGRKKINKKKKSTKDIIFIRGLSKRECCTQYMIDPLSLLSFVRSIITNPCRVIIYIL